jgi:DNA mismatch repair protein MSH4
MTATGRRSRAASSIGGEYQKIICAIAEARGVTPTVGLAFINISTGEAVLSQICDNQFYAKTLHKIEVFEPSQIIIAATAGPASGNSKLSTIIQENIYGVPIGIENRKYWSEAAGLDYISRLAFVEDAEAIKQSIGGNYFATCCFAAVGSKRTSYLSFSN